MAVWIQDPDFTLYHGDALTVLRELDAGSVDCCVTSPPYWGLRDYGVEGQVGLEATPDEYVTRMTSVFREVRRVLADTGTLWLNLGDSYVANGANSQVPQTKAHAGSGVAGPNRNGLSGLASKNLVGIPWRVAFALQADGWYLRSDIIWSKPNPMPESVTDRPTKSHEYVFLLSKSSRYYWDQEQLREPYHYDGRSVTKVVAGEGSAQHRNGERWPGMVRGKTWEERKAMGFRGDTKHPTTDAIQDGLAIPSFATPEGGRNTRSVWEITTQPYSEAHFAVFPEELARRCIIAGCPQGGVVLDPFMGSGTVALVARKHGRSSIGIELNETYCDLAARRLQQLSLLA